MELKVPGTLSHPCIGRRGCHSGRAVVVAQGCKRSEGREQMVTYSPCGSHQPGPSGHPRQVSSAGKWGWPVYRPGHGRPPGLCISPAHSSGPASPTVWWDLAFHPAPWNSPGFQPPPSAASAPWSSMWWLSPDARPAGRRPPGA